MRKETARSKQQTVVTFVT